MIYDSCVEFIDLIKTCSSLLLDCYVAMEMIVPVEKLVRTVRIAIGKPVWYRDGMSIIPWDDHMGWTCMDTYQLNQTSGYGCFRCWGCGSIRNCAEQNKIAVWTADTSSSLWPLTLSTLAHDTKNFGHIMQREKAGSILGTLGCHDIPNCTLVSRLVKFFWWTTNLIIWFWLLHLLSLVPRRLFFLRDAWGRGYALTAMTFSFRSKKIAALADQQGIVATCTVQVLEIERGSSHAHFWLTIP